MWRDVVSVKRLFKDMQCSLKADLGKMRCEISGANREAAGACSGLAANMKQATRLDEVNHLQTEREYIDLKNQIQSMRMQYDTAKDDVVQRDLRIQQMIVDLKGLEDRCMQAENQASQSQRLNDEIDRLHNALRDIAHAVVHDAESSGDPEQVQHLHLSQASMLPPRSPKRSSVRTSQAFAEGTISAVQAALHKYQLMIHDLQVKFQSSTEALGMTKKQLESSDHAREILTNKITEVTEKLDATNFQVSELFKERDNLQKNFDNMRNDRMAIEKARSDLNSLVSNMVSNQVFLWEFNI